jgi:hypothetical protein
MSTGPLEVRLAPLTQIIRHRLLPVAGEVLVHVGDRVQANDIVAQAPIEGRMFSIDLVQELGMSIPAISRRLQVSIGQTVTEGTPLASVHRLLRRSRVVKAPCAGTIQGITEGRLFLRQEPQITTLHAYMPGEVIEEYPHRGVAIRTAGALVRGIWGCGAESQGMLVVISEQPGDLLTWEHIGLRYRGALVVGGILEDARVLYRAKQFRLHGLIVGSMSPRLRPLCEQLALSVMITEGVGHIPMAEPFHELLRACQGRPAIMSGAGRDGHNGPEAIVPTASEAQTTALMVVRPISVGTRVRLIRAPYLGAMGQVVNLSTIPQETAIGTRAEGADVRLTDGRRLFVPYVNMELVD